MLLYWLQSKIVYIGVRLSNYINLCNETDRTELYIDLMKY